MPQHLKMFEWLSYGGLALGTVSALLESFAIKLSRAETIGAIIFVVIFVAIVAALIWAAARKGQVWAAWVLLVLLIPSIIVVITHFTGSGTPQWLSWLRSDTPPTTLQKTLDVISTIMDVGGMYFYFFGKRE